MEKDANLAHFFRYLWEEAGLMVITGNGDEIFKGRAAYNLRYNIKPADSGYTAGLERFFSACAMAQVSLADRESWGWSVSLPETSSGLFCGVEPEGMVCGRVLGTRTDQSIAAIQRQKAGEEMTQSHFLLNSPDPVRAVELYFEESDQNLARLAVADDGRCAMVKALPGGDFSKIADLKDDELIDFCFRLVDEESLKRLAEVLIFYECRCNDEMILQMITSLPADQRKDLWGDLKSLQIECPRCGRSYTINRQS